MPFVPPLPHAIPDLSALAASGLLAGFARRDLPKGFLLAAPGGEEDYVFVVGSGRLKVYLAGENRELSLSFLEAGDIYTTHTPTYVRTVTATTIWTMGTRDFSRRLGGDPSLPPAVMRVLGRLLTDAVKLAEDLAFREVPARLARFFIGVAQRRGQAVDEGWLIPLDLGVQDIAELLGATRQTISALINQWEREGLVHRRGRRSFLIPSLAALAARFPDAA